MSFINSLDNVKYLVNRYLWPTIFLIAGLILLNMSLTPSQEVLNNGKVFEFRQNESFMYAALFFIFASVVWFLFLFGIIKTAVSYVVLVVMMSLSAFLLYLNYMIIDEELVFDASYETRDLDIQARMGDIKAAEQAYKEMNGFYTNNFDDLIQFIKTGKKMKIFKKGSIPERKITVEERAYIYGPKDKRPLDNLMTEIEATVLARGPYGKTDPELIGFVRDTNFVPVMDAIFKEEKYLANREKIGASLPFFIDSLRYVPHTKNMVQLDTGSIPRGEMRVSTVMITMEHPMKIQNDKGETISVFYVIGDVNENHLRESWKK